MDEQLKTDAGSGSLQRMVRRLDATWLAECITTTDHGRAWLRYDTGDKTTKENWSIYCAIQETLRECGMQIEDVHIEHDCVSGHVVEQPNDQAQRPA